MSEKICTFCRKSFFYKKRSDRKSEYCSRKCFFKSRIGSTLSRGHRLKMSLAKKGKPRLDRRGQHSPLWRGSEASYQAIHTWVRYHLGRASNCSFCGVLGRKYSWANKSGKYFRDLNDWISLCYPCHFKYDSGQRYGMAQKRFKKILK